MATRLETLLVGFCLAATACGKAEPPPVPPVPPVPAAAKAKPAKKGPTVAEAKAFLAAMPVERRQDFEFVEDGD